jgi:hypothetical protein
MTGNSRQDEPRGYDTMPIRSGADGVPTGWYRLLLRSLRDFDRQPTAARRDGFPRPSRQPTGLVGAEFELWAQPPHRWLIRRTTDMPGQRLASANQLADAGHRHLTHPQATVEYETDPDLIHFTFRHLFQPETLLRHCTVTPIGTGLRAGRSADIVVAHPRPDVSPDLLACWGPDADEYQLHIDRATGIVLRNAATRHSVITNLDVVIQLDVERDRR